MAGRWWPHKRFMHHANYDDTQFKLQRWFGVDVFITVRLHPDAQACRLQLAACTRVRKVHACDSDGRARGEQAVK